MAHILLAYGADPLVSCLHTKLIHGGFTNSSTKWECVPWRTTAVHMLLGESAGLVLGPAPWEDYEGLRQECLLAVQRKAEAEKQERVLDTRVNQDGRFCCVVLC